MRLQGNVAIITGAGQGIGRAFALHFALEGASIVVADIQEHKATQVAQEIQERDGQALALKVDVSQPESVKEWSRRQLRTLDMSILL